MYIVTGDPTLLNTYYNKDKTYKLVPKPKKVTLPFDFDQESFNQEVITNMIMSRSSVRSSSIDSRYGGRLKYVHQGPIQYRKAAPVSFDIIADQKTDEAVAKNTANIKIFEL